MPDAMIEADTQPQSPVVAEAQPAQGVSEARKAHVSRVLKEVKAAKKHWARDFARMRADIYFAEGNHWPDLVPGMEEDRIVVDITARHIQLRTSALYAKNPTVAARRKDSLDFVIWDENIETLMLAQQRVMEAMQTGVADDSVVDDMLLIRDVAEGMARREALDKFGKTLELVFRDQIEHAQAPATFKSQVKDGIPRTLTTGVMYCKLDYERAVGRRPATENRLDEMRDRLARVQRMLDEQAADQDGTYAPDRAEADDLATQIAALEKEPPVTLKEGLVFSFPDSTAIIPDKKCKSLVGFRGCDWVAEEFCLSPGDIRETWKTDVSKSFKKYSVWYDGQVNEARSNTECDDLACVYVVYNRRTGLVYVVCDGYDDFLQEPAPPANQTQHFWPWYALIFNRLESQRSPFPKSDVRLMRPLQLELNRTMEALRQHRIANQPKYLGDASAFEEDEKINLMEYPPHEIIFVKALADGKKISDIIAELPKAAIDPTVYSTDVLYEAVMRVTGSQEANLGGTSGGDTTATESSIAEASRLSSQQSNADDLDDWLSLISRNAGELLVREMAFESVQQIAGPGAVWTTLSREQLATEMFLEVQAGSTGRPNQAQDLANLERTLPFLIQLPGLDPQKIAEWVIRVTDGRMKPSDLMNAAIRESIVSMNRGAPALLGGPTDPNAQGDRGAQNAPNDDESRGGPVPGKGFAPRIAA